MLAKTKPKVSESLEDYLEAIFHIVAEKQAARAKDIAKRLKVCFIAWEFVISQKV